MTPRSYIILAVVAIVFGLGGLLGYFIGHHGAVKAETALNKDVTVGQVLGATHDQLVNSLKAQNQQLQQSYDDLQTRTEAKLADSNATWTKALAVKDATLQQALKSSTNAAVVVADLKSKLFLATTPTEKAALQAQLNDAQKQLVQATARTDGLRCLDVPIPTEWLNATNSTAKP